MPCFKQMVVTREMPPYHYDPGVGIQDLKNDWRMTEAEIRTIADWVDAGAPLGDPEDLPPPATFPDGSSFAMEEYFGRPPDVIVSSTPYDVPAVGADRWWRPIVPSGIDASLCIAGVETSFARAAEVTLEKLCGLRLSESTIERVTEGAGERVAQLLEDEETFGERESWAWQRDAWGRRVAYVSLDATGVRQQGEHGAQNFARPYRPDLSETARPWCI